MNNFKTLLFSIVNRSICICLTCTMVSSSISAQLIINIKGIPNKSDSNISIFLASPLSNWAPADSNFRVKKNKDEKYQIVITPPEGIFEFKFTKGSWLSVESDKNGEDIPNRSIHYKGQKEEINCVIEGWKVVKEKPSTKVANVQLMDDKFYIPQLGKTRKIWIYLPPDYEKSNQSYPVVYMHDGQNLFDEKTSFSGEWKVDETLNSFFDAGDSGIIVVGIENGESSRIAEYTPWPNEMYGGGKGKEYAEFITQTLKPYIDQNYRTLPNRDHTGIMGSSLGGLISFYIALEYQDVFGKAGVFSPSFWFSEKVYQFAQSTQKKQDIQFYFLGGELESPTLIDEMQKMIDILIHSGYSKKNMKFVTSPDGDHNEAFWARAFPAAYTWLFQK